MSTTWNGQSGSWDDASNWTNGVPTSTDTAIFEQGSYTISDGGVSGTIDGQSITLATLSGTISTNSLLLENSTLHLGSTASLTFNSGTLDGSQLTLDSGSAFALSNESYAEFSGQTLVLSNSAIVGDMTFADSLKLSSLQVAGTNHLLGNDYLSAVLSGSGILFVGDLSAPVTTLTVMGRAPNTFTGSVVLQNAALSFGVGVVATNIAPTYVTEVADTISAGSQSLLVFVQDGNLSFTNSTPTPIAGQTTIIGAVGAQVNSNAEAPAYFGSLSVNGGYDFSLVVFAGDMNGQIVGGTAGNNVIVAGASAAPSSPFGPGSTVVPGAVTVTGGGNGDLLVATGRLNNLFTAGSGNETIFGGGATGNNQFFGGSGADVIVAGAGHDTIVNGNGSATINAGTGSSAIFAGAGRSVIIGGTGTDYVQAGTGAASVFTGTGQDVLGIVNGQGGGAVLVSGFRVGIDKIDAQGYAAAPLSRSLGGNTFLTFSDATQITLYGISQLPQTSFV